MLFIFGICLLSVVFGNFQPINTVTAAAVSTVNVNSNITYSQINTHTENVTIIGDSELSASERNRRLIPYMTFYLPAPDFPIDQQYFPAQKAHSGTKPQHNIGTEPLPPPTAISIPTAYVHMKLPAAATADSLQYQQQHTSKHSQQFPHNTGEVYHPIAYGGQHPLKHETRVYQPHTGALQLELQQQQQALHSQQYRQQPQQSKINLTPFTSSNSVPGHFIPIIYTSLSSTKGDTNQYKSSPSESNELGQVQQEQQLPIQQQKQQKQTHEPQQIVQHGTKYSLPPSSKPTSGGQSHHPTEQHQLQLIAITPTATATSGVPPTSSPINHVINEKAPDKGEHQKYSFDTLSYNAQFQPPKPGHIFYNDQVRNSDNMTPQQKYVLYLQQRIRYNKQQKFAENNKEALRQPEKYIKYQPQQQEQQIFFLSSTADSMQEVDDSYVMFQEPWKLKQSKKFPQHSPVGHAVYPRPELPVPANHQTEPQQHQVLHIPVDSEFIQQYPRPHTSMQKQQSSLSTPPLTQNFVVQYPREGSPIPPQYIDYIIEEPKQSLEDEQQQQQKQHLHHQKYPDLTSKKGYIQVNPKSSYIIQSTAAPPHPSNETPMRDMHTPLRWPANEKQPYLRLKPVKHQSSQLRPSSVLAYPKGIPVSGTQEYFYSTRPDKLKPSYEDVSQEVKQLHFTPNKPTSLPLYRPPESTPQKQQPPKVDPNPLPDIHSSSLADILHKLQDSNHLPKTLTAENIDNSIKTLITILNNLKHTQTIDTNPQQHGVPHSITSPDYDYATESIENVGDEHDIASKSASGSTSKPGPNTGKPGVDYPNYAEIPVTTFNCANQRYKGFFGDPETHCQVWHYCDLNGGKASFLCPNGTIFSQIALTCDWWFNVKCSTTSQLYVLNERLYKYILPFNPKFPEDYSGPIVDKYLALKFKEMEEKMRQEKQKLNVTSNTSADTGAEPHANESENSLKQMTTTIASTTVKSLSKEHQSINSQVGEQSSEKNLLIDDEVDDISQRGLVNIDGSSITLLSEDKERLSLNKKPIVVTSTSDQDFETKNTEIFESMAEYAKQEPGRTQTPRDITKISVEKVEVIEIQPEGLEEILKPAMILSTNEKVR